MGNIIKSINHQEITKKKVVLKMNMKITNKPPFP